MKEEMLTVSTAVPLTEWYCPVVLLGSEDWEDMMMMIEKLGLIEVVCAVECVCEWVVSLMASLARTATRFYTVAILEL